MPLSINRRYRHLKRYRKIGEVLLRHGFGYLIQQLDLTHILPPIKRLQSLRPKETAFSIGKRVRLVAEELGPTFVKFGQLLSTRPDVVPPEIISELESLQDRVPPFPFSDVRRQIENELGFTLEELFRSFDPDPLAAASIGQVHKAVLVDGRNVVVKVQRPNIHGIVRTDLEILHGLASTLGDKFNREVLDPVKLVSEFRRVIERELDYGREGRNIERFRLNFQNDENIVIPQVYWHLSTESVLTMEYIEGCKVSNLGELRASGYDPNKLADITAQAFMKQIFEFGFFHADPHPGNLLVCAGNRLAFIDFGMVGRIDRSTMQSLARMLVAVTRRDIDELLKVLEELEAFDSLPTRELRMDLADLIDAHYGKTLSQLDFGQVIDDLLALVRRHPFRLPPELILLAKALITVEGIGSRLVPDFNVMEMAEPFAKNWVKKYYSPGEIGNRGLSQARDWATLLKCFPGDVETLFKILKAGEFRIHFHHEGLEKLMSRLDIVSNRLTFGIIVAALIVGSSLLLMLDRGPHFMQIPIIGLFGFVLAGLIGLWLLLSILRSGRF